jgi:hypothetical protein
MLLRRPPFLRPAQSLLIWRRYLMAKTAAIRKRQSKLKRAIKALQRLIDQRNKDFEALEREGQEELEALERQLGL